VAELVNEVQSAGKFNIIFDGSKFSSGVYFYPVERRFICGNKETCAVEIRKILPIVNSIRYA